MLTLRNKTKTIKTYNLALEALREAGGAFGYQSIKTGVVDQDKNTGTRHARGLRRALPSSITFLGGEEKSGLPNILRQVPDIASAIERHELVIVSETAEEEPAAPEPPVALSDESTATSSPRTRRRATS